MLETDRLSIGDSRAKLSILVDGVEKRPGQGLEGHKLGRGFHVIDLEGEIPDFGVGRLQLLLNVISPIEVEAEPITDVEISDEVTGGLVEVRISNRGSSTHGVRLEVDGVPRGWTAAFAEEPFVVLAPGEDAVVPVRVDRMYLTDESWEPAAFAVRASVVGKRASDVVSTFQVRPRGRRPRKRVVEGSRPPSLLPNRLLRLAERKRRRKSGAERKPRRAAPEVAARSSCGSLSPLGFELPPVLRDRGADLLLIPAPPGHPFGMFPTPFGLELLALFGQPGRRPRPR